VVLFIRFLDRAGKGIRSAPRDTIIAAVTPADRRGAAFGLHRAFDNAGAVLGPLVAAALLGALALPVRAVFALSAVPAAFAVLVLLLGVHETGQPATAPAPAAPEALRPPLAPLPSTFRRTAFVITLFTLSASSDTFILLRARDVGFAASAIPLLWAFSNAVRSAFSTWGGRLSDRLGRRRVLLAAWSLYAACYLGFAAARTPVALAAILGVYSLHAALAEGTERALVADLVPAASRGRAFGWLHGLTGMAALPASVGFGWIWSHAGAATAFGVGAGIAGLAAAGLLLLVPPPAAPGVP
jgi:MFS family permease